MSDIVRMRTDARMSQIVIHGDTIHLAGQVGSDLLPLESAFKR